MKLTENEAYVLAYLDDEQIAEYNNIAGALPAAMAADAEATAAFATSYVIGMDMIAPDIEPMGDLLDEGEEPEWL